VSRENLITYLILETIFYIATGDLLRSTICSILTAIVLNHVLQVAQRRRHP